ncbi:MAG: trimethylamine methyltransferase family protein [Spirochaetota bacterium]|nr:MAG: trimethylamine methyltransferase family protein [Spirochaetota bacterium]
MGSCSLSFEPMNILTEKDCNLIHETAMDILNKVGVHIPHQKTRSILIDAGAHGGTGERVYIPESVVLNAIKSAPSVVSLTGLDPTHKVDIGGSNVYFMSGAGLLDVLDLEGNIRPSTLEDVADFTRLCDALEYLDVNHGVIDPADVLGPGLYPLAASRIIPNTSKPTALVIDTGKDVEAIAEMASVALGSAKAVRDRPFFTIHDSNARPPLHHDPKNSEVIIEACSRGFPTGLSVWPMIGLSSPITIAGTMAQKYANFFAGLVLAQSINPGNPFLFPVVCGGVEMRTGNVVSASPDIALVGMAGAQMARFYNLPSVTVIATDAKVPDAQSGAEKAFLLTTQALAGINLIHGCTSEMDGMMIASLEQCVIDNEIMMMVRHLISGFIVDRENLAFEVIKEVSIGDGNYLAHQHTLERFRKLLFEPKVFTKDRRADWISKGSLSARQQARMRAEKILVEHFPSHMSKEQVAEIEKIAESYR